MAQGADAVCGVGALDPAFADDCKSVKMRRAGYRLLVRNQPEQQAPPVQRLRVRYAKRGRLRFTSHRDFSRAFERAVFRARIPMAYSSGFNPHPRISYAGAAPTGSASEAEYLEIGLAQVLDPDDVHRMLDESLPEGLDVLEVVESPGGSLSDLLEGSRWEITLNGAGDLSELVATFLDTEAVEVQRMTKKGLRVFDARAAVLAMGVQVEGDTTVLDVVLEHVVPAVRPDDVLSALAVVGEYPAEVVPLLTRVQQGTLDRAAAQVRDPLSVQP